MDGRPGRSGSGPRAPERDEPGIRRAGSHDLLVERLLAAETSNEISAVLGLDPITGISGPKVFY